MKMKIGLAVILSASISGSLWGVSKGPEWDLSELFPSKKAWLQAIEELKKEVKTVDSCKGKLTSSSKTLQSCLDKMSSLRKDYFRISTWASLQMASDNQKRLHIEQSQLTSSLGRDLQTRLAFVGPELANLSEKKLQGFLKENKRLAVYDQYLRNSRIQAKHILGPKEEKLFSAIQPLAGGSASVYNMLSNADISSIQQLL